MKKRNFENKVVLITGAASGIGLAVARRFARAGAHLGLIDMDRQALDVRRDEFSQNAIPVAAAACDVSDADACRAAVKLVIDKLGGIDLLFANAGITQRSAFVDTNLDVYHRVMNVNFFGALYCTKAAIESVIARRGMIISNESIAGVAPVLGRTGYCASKHAMHGFFTSLRTELQPLGVHVMIVCPGFIQTNLQTRALGADGRVTHHPQSHIGKHDTPDHAAEAIFRGAEREKNMLVLTPVGKIGYWLSRLAPAFYEKQMARRLRSELEPS